MFLGLLCLNWVVLLRSATPPENSKMCRDLDCDYPLDGTGLVLCGGCKRPEMTEDVLRRALEERETFVELLKLSGNNMEIAKTSKKKSISYSLTTFTKSFLPAVDRLEDCQVTGDRVRFYVELRHSIKTPQKVRRKKDSSIDLQSQLGSIWCELDDASSRCSTANLAITHPLMAWNSFKKDEKSEKNFQNAASFTEYDKPLNHLTHLLANHTFNENLLLPTDHVPANPPKEKIWEVQWLQMLQKQPLLTKRGSKNAVTLRCTGGTEKCKTALQTARESVVLSVFCAKAKTSRDSLRAKRQGREGPVDIDYITMAIQGEINALQKKAADPRFPKLEQHKRYIRAFVKAMKLFLARVSSVSNAGLMGKLDAEGARDVSLKCKSYFRNLATTLAKLPIQNYYQAKRKEDQLELPAGGKPQKPSTGGQSLPVYSTGAGKKQPKEPALFGI